MKTLVYRTRPYDKEYLEMANRGVLLYTDPVDGAEPEIRVMEMADAISGNANNYVYRVCIPAMRPIEHYTPRVIPYFDGAPVPLEIASILWYER